MKISLLKLMRNIWKYNFQGEGVLLNSIMDIHGSNAKGGADQSWMAVDVRRGVVKIFHFGVRNSMTLKWKDYRNP